MLGCPTLSFGESYPAPSIRQILSSAQGEREERKQAGIGSQPQWFKRVFPQQPQVSESNAPEIRVHGGHAGIPNETAQVGRSSPRWRSGGSGFTGTKPTQHSRVELLALSCSSYTNAAISFPGNRWIWSSTKPINIWCAAQSPFSKSASLLGIFTRNS
jgi:hypothetical protein